MTPLLVHPGGRMPQNSRRARAGRRRTAIVAKRNKSMKLRGKRIPVMTYVVTNLKTEHRKQLEVYLQEITAEGEEVA